jgi:WD40 repeat protein
VTSLHFGLDGRLVSAGRDNVLKVWKLDGVGKLVGAYPGRTGEVTDLGVSPDGRRVLFDMGEELRILDAARGTSLGTLRNQKQGRFQGFAAFSPTGQLVLTAASNSRLQLWRTPTTAEETQFFRQSYTHGFHRGSLLAFGAEPGFAGLASLMVAETAPRLWQLSGQEVRHFNIPNGALVNCGVFAPDESVFFTGSSDKSVHVWAVPNTAQRAHSLEARITYVGSQVERGTDMVRIRAELENPHDLDRRLRSGLYAVLRLFPETAGLK